jgi:nucleoside-diphosphate-sugar epimerase
MKIAITGATGFIGRHLLARLDQERVTGRVLSRQEDFTAPGVETVKGDLRESSDVARFMGGCDAIVNLAYASDWSDQEIDSIAGNLAESAISSGVRRFVHVSTAVVVGSCSAEVIDENTLCKPTTVYESRKLRIEEILGRRLKGKVALAILRPTAVFGPGGQNLVKLADDLRGDAEIIRKLRYALLRNRRLNLVSVANVVEAIWFALTANRDFDGDRFIVSDGDDPANNYGDVASFLAPRLGLAVPQAPAAPWLDRELPLLLRVRRRSLSNPSAIFSSRRLHSAGYSPAVAFTEELDRFASWYRARSEASLR